MQACPCTSGKKYESCCGPYVTGAKKAPSAEALMRSRYTAYVVREIEHIARTNDPDSKDDFDREMALEWAKNSEWLGLEVLAATDDTVEFIARFKANGKELSHHELSTFRKVNDDWYFVDGKTVQKPMVRTGPKVGRNDPCPCGSGKKFKKCCVDQILHE